MKERRDVLTGIEPRTEMTATTTSPTVTATALTNNNIVIEPHTNHELRSLKFWRGVPQLLLTFRKLELSEDVESYFCAFEAHMDGYSVRKQWWTKHLAPILNPDATAVYTAMESEERRTTSS